MNSTVPATVTSLRDVCVSLLNLTGIPRQYISELVGEASLLQSNSPPSMPKRKVTTSKLHNLGRQGEVHCSGLGWLWNGFKHTWDKFQTLQRSWWAVAGSM